MDEWDYRRFLEQVREFNQVKSVYSLYYKNKNRLRGSSCGPTASGAVGPHSVDDNNEKLINIIAYCLNPNHFHLSFPRRRESRK
jgi:hypothetical protein